MAPNLHFNNSFSDFTNSLYMLTNEIIIQARPQSLLKNIVKTGSSDCNRGLFIIIISTVFHHLVYSHNKTVIQALLPSFY